MVKYLSSMKAILHTEYGPPEGLKLGTIPKPIPGDHDILVKVHATTVNRTDCAMLRAQPFIMRFMTGLSGPKNPILGTEFAGVVEARGQRVTAFEVGDRVFGFDDSGMSSHAEYLVTSEKSPMAIIPDGIGFDIAAASTEGMHYAINFANKVPLKKGDTVLVNGASGGIGSAAVQLLVHYGMVVTGVCNTKNIERIKALGVYRIIDYQKEDFTKDGHVYDYVFDAVGKSSFGKCKPLLKPGGAYISSELGHMSQNLFLALLKPVMGSRKVIFPYPGGKRESVKTIRGLLQQGAFKPLIDQVYNFEDIPKAFAYVEKGMKTGNVVITFSK